LVDDESQPDKNVRKMNRSILGVERSITVLKLLKEITRIAI